MRLFSKFIFIAVFFAACGKKEASRTVEQASMTDGAIAVRTAKVELQKKAMPIVGAGVLGSTDEQRPAFKIGGVISKIYVDEGDLVRPGQLLATLDLTEIDASVRQASLALEKSERDLRRVEGLRRDSAATLELLENASTGRNVAAENLKIAQFNQKFAAIRASKGGRVVKKLMNAGEIVGPGTPVFVIFSEGQSDWALKIALSDRDWARLSVGMMAKIRFDAHPGEVFEGRVSELPPTADPASGLYPVEVKIKPNGKKMVAGLFGKAEIETKAARELSVVPIEAILEGAGREAFVFVLRSDGSTVEKRPVRIAFLEKDSAVLLDGFEKGAEVVTAGSPYLTEKSIVKKI